MRSTTANVKASRRLKPSASRELEREVRELRKANDPEAGQRVFRPGGARPPHQVLRPSSTSIQQFGVESICRAMQIAPSAYWRHFRWHNEGSATPRAARCELCLWFSVWQANFQVYGADKVWRQLNREGVAVARCTVERLMRQEGLQGVRRGKALRTTVPDPQGAMPAGPGQPAIPCRAAQPALGLGLPTSRPGRGWAYVAFVVDVFSRRIVGWRQSSSMHTEFVLDALEQALYDRKPSDDGSLTHHSDRGSQYLSIRYSERLAEAGIEPSVGPKATATTTPWPRRSMGSTRPK